jgi:hypothetical protein
MSYQVHLLKPNGTGMATKTACGRNQVTTVIGTNWAGFTGEYEANRCKKCATSKTAEFLKSKQK